MLKGMNCPTCGGNLRYSERTHYITCDFCGKVFMDTGDGDVSSDLSVKDIRSVRTLRTQGKRAEALSMLTQMQKEDPDNIVLIWEMLVFRTGCSSVSDFLMQKKEDIAALEGILDNPWYKKLKEEDKSYAGDIEQYIEARRQHMAVSDKIGRARHEIELEISEKAADHNVRVRRDQDYEPVDRFLGFDGIRPAKSFVTAEQIQRDTDRNIDTKYKDDLDTLEKLDAKCTDLIGDMKRTEEGFMETEA